MNALEPHKSLFSLLKIAFEKRTARMMTPSRSSNLAIPILLSPPRCLHFAVSLSLSPPRCLHFAVSTSLSPSHCSPLAVPLSLSPSRCSISQFLFFMIIIACFCFIQNGIAVICRLENEWWFTGWKIAVFPLFMKNYVASGFYPKFKKLFFLKTLIANNKLFNNRIIPLLCGANLPPLRNSHVIFRLISDF